MPHGPHTGPTGTIWHDGCPECDQRARELPRSLSELDDRNRLIAWRGMRAWRWTGGHPDFELDGLSDNDAALFDTLYTFAVYLQRGGIQPEEVEQSMIDEIDLLNVRAWAAGLTIHVNIDDLR